MEFKLNKIDPEVRHRVNELTSSGKVHSKNSLIINEDHKKRKKEEHNFEEELKKQKDKGKQLQVEAVMSEAAGKEAAEEEKIIGTILDIRK